MSRAEIPSRPGTIREPISERARRLPASRLGGLLGGVRSRHAINLAVGTPETPTTPPGLLGEATVALWTGHNQYADPIGDPDLRAAIAGAQATPADPDTEITVTVGASEALFVALQSTVDPGDEVVVFEPFYELFLGVIAAAGGVPRFVPTRPPHWRHDPAELRACFGPRTKAILLNSPGNPTGRVLGDDELAEIAELCEQWDVTVISDETYGAYVYDDRVHRSVGDVPALRDRGIVIGSLSKSHAVSGWRLGFLRAAPSRTEAMRRMHVLATGGAPAPLQRAAVRAGVLDPDAWSPLHDMRVLRDRAVKIFERIGFDCVAPEGGCYLMAGVGPVTDLDSEAFARSFAEQTGVLVAPGTVFCADPELGKGHVRIAFNKDPKTFDVVESRVRPHTRAMHLAFRDGEE